MDKHICDLLTRLNVNSYNSFDFDVPNYLVQGITNYLEDVASKTNKIKWADVKSLAQLAISEGRLNGIQASLLLERYCREENKDWYF